LNQYFDVKAHFLKGWLVIYCFDVDVHYYNVNAHYFGGCPLTHKYWSKTINFICNQMLKDNDFSLAILMHVEIMFSELKKSCKKNYPST